MEKIPMTAAGYTQLEAELRHRQQVERPRIIQQITEARGHGDLSENAEYHAANRIPRGALIGWPASTRPRFAAQRADSGDSRRRSR